jgi:hypothetical protein
MKPKDKKYSNITFGKTYHPITQNQMRNMMLESFKVVAKKDLATVNYLKNINNLKIRLLLKVLNHLK